MIESRISGEEEPSAISVRLATVGFHTRDVTDFVRPFGSVVRVVVSCEVMASIASMKRSATMATARNIQSRIVRKSAAFAGVCTGPVISRPSLHVSGSESLPNHQGTKLSTTA